MCVIIIYDPQYVGTYYARKLIPFLYMTTQQKHLVYSSRFLCWAQIREVFFVFCFFDSFSLEKQEKWRKVRRPLVEEPR